MKKKSRTWVIFENDVETFIEVTAKTKREAMEKLLADQNVELVEQKEGK